MNLMKHESSNPKSHNNTLIPCYGVVFSAVSVSPSVHTGTRTSENKSAACQELQSLLCGLTMAQARGLHKR